MSKAEFRKDPVDLVPRDLAPRDLELWSFVVAGLSYGRVEQIFASVRSLEHRLGSARLFELIHAKKISWFKQKLFGWTHRLNTDADLVALVCGLKVAIKTHGSLCRLYQTGGSSSPEEKVRNFTTALAACFPEDQKVGRGSKQKTWAGTGPSWFFPHPDDGSACKRLLMWLRWMVRTEEPDFGIWQTSEVVDPALPRASQRDLLPPVDTHILQWAIRNDIVQSQTATWKTVLLIDQHYRKLDPDDPTKFDFELAHQGMTMVRKPRKKRSIQNCLG